MFNLSTVNVPLSIYCEPLCKHSECWSAIDLFNEALIEAIHNSSINLPCTINSQKCKSTKAWWTESCSSAKALCQDIDFLWHTLNRPKQGNIFQYRLQLKSRYKLELRRAKWQYQQSEWQQLSQMEVSNKSFTCRLNGITRKDQPQNVSNIDGSSTTEECVIKFRDHFSCVCCNVISVESWKDKYELIAERTTGSLLHYNFSTNFIRMVFSDLTKSNAAGSDNIQYNELANAGDGLFVYIGFLFKLVVTHGYCPRLWRQCVQYPVLKDKLGDCTSLDNYRDISISNVVSKLFELFIIKLFPEIFKTDELQFAYKVGGGCDSAFFVLMEAILRYYSANTPVYVCMLDAKKAFNRVDHYALLCKLLNKGLDLFTVRVLEGFLTKCEMVVIYAGCTSEPYTPSSGIRQGGVLSGHLYAIYLDDLIIELRNIKSGCFIGQKFVGILAYADDIALLASTRQRLQSMIDYVVNYGKMFSIEFSVKKSVVLCFIPKVYSKLGTPLFNLEAETLKVVEEHKYLGFLLGSKIEIPISFRHNLKNFYAAYNSIFSAVPGKPPINCAMEIIKSRCLPKLLYGTDFSFYNFGTTETLHVAWNNSLRKIAGLPWRSNVTVTNLFLDTCPLSVQIHIKTILTYKRFLNSVNPTVAYVARGLRCVMKQEPMQN